MYVQGSQECLKNAEHLFEDATTLLRNGSFGSAQSLAVHAIEEAAKAIILELANLDYIEKEVVEQSMWAHPPKKLVLLAMEKGLLFAGNIDRRYDKKCVIDKGRMQELERALKAGLKDMENKRQNGFYVKVDVSNGAIVNSPNNLKESEIEGFARKAESFLKLCKHLCRLFRYYSIVDEGKVRSNLRIFQENLENVYA